MSKLIFGLLFIISFSTFNAFSQTPTPTPEYPDVPGNSGHDRCTFYGGPTPCPIIAKNDFYFYKRSSSPPFYVRDNDINSEEIYLLSQTQNLGKLKEASCQCTLSSSTRQVVTYREFAADNGTPSVYGVDFGRYYMRSIDDSYLRFFTSNIADIIVFVTPDDGAENAGNNCPLGLPGQSVGSPVNPTNGNMWLEETDYTLPGAGEAINIKRFYNSIIQTSGMFGRGWTTPYDESLIAYGDYALRLNLPDGRAVYLGRRDTSSAFTITGQKFFGSVVKNADGSYNLNYNDGRIHHFNQNGSLGWLKDRTGNQTTLAYNANYNLTGITDSSGRVLTLTTNNGLVTQIGDSLGQAASYVYNTDGTLQTVSFPDGSKDKFEYTTIGGKIYLTTVKDALDHVLETHQYDTSGRATTSETDGGTNKYTFQYDLQDYYYNAYTVVTDGNQNVTRYWINNKGVQNVVKRVEGLCGCGGSGSENTAYEYDEHFNVVKKTDALGNITNYTYDGSGNRLSMTDVLGTETYTYNSLSEMLTRTDRMGGVTTNTYDAAGNLLTTKDALNKVTTLTYNANAQPLTVKDALNQTTTLTYDAQSRLTQIKDANNKTTNYGYDARARLTGVTNAISETTSFQYDLNNRLKKATFPDANFVSYIYDAAGRRTQMTDARGNNTTYGYDNANRLISMTDALSHSMTYGYDLMSNPTSQTDALGNVTNYEYDDFNRLKKTVYPAATANATRLQESITYDTVGNVKTKTDTANRQTVYDYDTANRLIKTTDALGEITQFEYNQRSQMTKVRDALSQEYVFTYDALGRQLSQTRAGAVMSYEYNAVGSRTKRSDYANRLTAYQYDALNRLKKINYYSGTNNDIVSQISTFNYDDLSRLTSAANEEGTVSFAYDTRGRMNAATDVFGHSVTYGYDANGNRNLLKLDGTTQTTYAYDAANRLTTLTDDANQNFTFGYDIANRLINKAMPNGVATTYNYDGMSRLTRLKNQGSSTLTDNNYSYNAANQISSIAELLQTKNYGYDNVDRLTGMTNGTANESYSFDNVGNRTSSSQSATYNYQPFNKLANTATASYSYDANGNLRAKSEGSNLWQYVWDGENRLSSVSNRKQTVRYRYDALGRRVRRYFIRGGSEENTKYIYDGMDVLADDNGGVLTKYQNGLGIDNKLKVSINGTAKYFLTDHLGSTVGLTNQSGAATEQTAYDSFGIATTSLSTRYQFTGREYDSFTGLQYSRARWYDAKTGRFISEDPIGFRGGINEFAYANNNASNLVDPSGLDGCRKLPNGKCEPIPEIPTSGGEPPRRTPWFISDPPRPSPTPFATPSPSATPFPPRSTPPSAPPTGSEPGSPCGCETAIPRLPDFVSFSGHLGIPQLGGFVGIGISVSVDRYGQVYATIPSVGAGFPSATGASLVGGWILQKCKPTPKESDDYLSSWGGSITGFAPNFLGGGVGSSSGGTAILAGVGTPGGGVSGGYSFRVY